MDTDHIVEGEQEIRTLDITDLERIGGSSRQIGTRLWMTYRRDVPRRTCRGPASIRGTPP